MAGRRGLASQRCLRDVATVWSGLCCGQLDPSAFEPHSAAPRLRLAAPRILKRVEVVDDEGARLLAYPHLPGEMKRQSPVEGEGQTVGGLFGRDELEHAVPGPPKPPVRQDHPHPWVLSEESVNHRAVAHGSHRSSAPTHRAGRPESSAAGATATKAAGPSPRSGCSARTPAAHRPWGRRRPTRSRCRFLRV